MTVKDLRRKVYAFKKGKRLKIGAVYFSKPCLKIPDKGLQEVLDKALATRRIK